MECRYHTRVRRTAPNTTEPPCRPPVADGRSRVHLLWCDHQRDDTTLLVRRRTKDIPDEFSLKVHDTTNPDPECSASRSPVPGCVHLCGWTKVPRHQSNQFFGFNLSKGTFWDSSAYHPKIWMQPPKRCHIQLPPVLYMFSFAPTATAPRERPASSGPGTHGSSPPSVWASKCAPPVASKRIKRKSSSVLERRA